MTDPTDIRRRYTFPARLRLTQDRHFDRVYAARTRKVQGPLVVYAAPNDLGHCRLGLSVSRRVGTAVVRNRIKRLLRESFRLMQHDLPTGCGYDLIIVVRRHEPLNLAAYQHYLHKGVRQIHQLWSRRAPLTRNDQSDNPDAA